MFEVVAFEDEVCASFVDADEGFQGGNDIGHLGEAISRLLVKAARDDVAKLAAQGALMLLAVEVLWALVPAQADLLLEG